MNLSINIITIVAIALNTIQSHAQSTVINDQFQPVVENQITDTADDHSDQTPLQLVDLIEENTSLNFDQAIPTQAENKAIKLGYYQELSKEEDTGTACHNDMVRYFQREAEFEKEKKANAFIF